MPHPTLLKLRQNLHFKVSHVCLAVIPLGIVVYLAMGDRWDEHYCTRCGLLRDTFVRTCFGYDGQGRVSYTPTEFRRLYQANSPDVCQHQWQGCSSKHGCRQGEIRKPVILTDDVRPWVPDLLHRLARLSDSKKVMVVLASFDMTHLDYDYVAAVLPALGALKKVENASDEEEWWAKYRHVFTQNPAAHPRW